MGAGFALMGILILYWGVRIAGPGPFTWSGLVLASQAIPPAVLKVAFLFILVGFGTKAGLVPMHTWLPDAHSQAPSPVCALLSGVETTTVLYAIMRLLPVLQGAHGDLAGTWFVVFGLVSVGAAAFLLVKVTDYKRLFAFSTVEHMGIILVAAGLGGSAAHFGATLQMVSHAVTKSFCFFGAGITILAVDSREIASIRGLIRSSPCAGVALMVGGLAISGAPPFAVFLSEFSILRAAILAGHYVPALLLVLFIIIAFCGIMFQVNRMVFGSAGRISERQSLPVSSIVALVLAVTPVVILGLFVPGPLDEMLRMAAAALGR
jgi:hydrogenase-4 component F